MLLLLLAVDHTSESKRAWHKCARVEVRTWGLGLLQGGHVSLGSIKHVFSHFDVGQGGTWFSNICSCSIHWAFCNLKSKE